MMSGFHETIANPPLAPNPYSPSSFTPGGDVESPHPGTAELASLAQRFLGFLLDSLLGIVLGVPGVAMMIVGLVIAINARQQQQTEEVPDLAAALLLIGLGLFVLSQFLMIGIQIFLLVKRSQTFGKYLMKTQVVDFDTGQRAPFVQAAILRIFVNSLICSVPLIGALYFLVDTFFIFRDDRRCIHDLLANTIVIDISNR